MQTQMVRTTITLPTQLLQQLKMQAVREKKTVSKLVVEAAENKLKTSRKPFPILDPLKMLGKYKLHAKKNETYRREDMYDEYLKHKVPF